MLFRVEDLISKLEKLEASALQEEREKLRLGERQDAELAAARAMAYRNVIHIFKETSNNGETA